MLSHKSRDMAGFLTKSISQLIGSNYYKTDDNRETVVSPYILGTSPPDSSMELYILDNKLQVCSCPKGSINEICYSIIKIALLPDSRPHFFSITETREEYTLILTEEDYLELSSKTSLESTGDTWRALTVSVGALGTFNELVGVTKIAKSAIGPLADNNISVLCLSTYQSDYILIRDIDLDNAIKCLSTHFKIFTMKDHKRVNDSKQLSTSPSSPVPTKVRPIVHSYTSSSDVYHITGLDKSKFSAATQVLLDLIFFSGSTKVKEKDEQAFFHFTRVRSDISLVLNDYAFNKFPANVLYTRQFDDKWRVIAVGENPLGFEECGIVAQVVEPLAAAQLSTYYISSFGIEYCMVMEKDVQRVLDTFEKLKKENFVAEQTAVPTNEQQPVEAVDGNPEDTTNKDLMELLPAKHMSLGESLQNFEHDVNRQYNVSPLQYSRSPQTPISEGSSYGTSPMSDVDGPPSLDDTVRHVGDTGITEPIPIPDNCLRDSLTRLKC